MPEEMPALEQSIDSGTTVAVSRRKTTAFASGLPATTARWRGVGVRVAAGPVLQQRLDAGSDSAPRRVTYTAVVSASNAYR